MSRLGIYVLAVVCSLATICYAQEEEVNNVTRDAFTFTLPNIFGSKPFLETRNENGRMLGVHIPWILDWQLHNREGDGIWNTKYQWRWLSGLVNFEVDRQRDPATGEMVGPFKWSILGIPLIDNGEQPLPPQNQQPPPPPPTQAPPSGNTQNIYVI